MRSSKIIARNLSICHTKCHCELSNYHE